jgi:hypothetical protein
LLDHYDEATEHNLSSASPIMTVQGKTVHVIWGAGELPYRHHRYSTDAGLTWSTTRRIFGELHGQAFDGFAIDGAGRVHFIGQIRYPMGIYHAYWDETRWSTPSLIYLIAANEGDEGKDLGDLIAAHNTNPVVRAGNQLVITFADNPSFPNRRLFAMQRTLDDIQAIETVATPTPSPTLVPEPTATSWQPTPRPTLLAASLDPRPTDTRSSAQAPSWDLALRLAVVPTLLLLAGTVLVQWWFRFKA